MLDAIKHITDDIFCFRKTVRFWCTCVVHATQSCPTAATLSTSFLLNHAPNSPELNALIARFRGSYSSVSMSPSQRDWRNQGAASWILAMHWYSIWM